MRLLVKEIKRRLTEEAVDLKAADFEMIRKLLADNSITFGSVRRGDFGSFAKTVSEEFPFPEGDGSDTFN